MSRLTGPEATRLVHLASEVGPRGRRARRRLAAAVVGGDLVTTRVLMDLGYRLDDAWRQLVADIPVRALTAETRDGETLECRDAESALLGRRPGPRLALARAGDSRSAFALRHVDAGLPGTSVVELHDLRTAAALATRFGRAVSLGAVRARPDDVAPADDGGGASC